ncbi:acyl carrier protein [Streptomyces sp. NBC_01723]|uniref:acyl carrier protein n=1 Tax=unclassified Streptomyces TaxID=2593676 RepID=UPI002788B85C|nr:MULTISPECIES: acyl carrier protein [unclassified Streptomyces]MDQ0404235.1 acyl carrier protein [Streptomyces sp. DSM 40167]
MSAFQDRLFALVSEKLGMTPEELDTTSTFDQLDLDSLALIELSVIVQKEFGVQIDETALTSENTFADILAEIDGKVAVA